MTEQAIHSPSSPPPSTWRDTLTRVPYAVFQADETYRREQERIFRGPLRAELVHMNITGTPTSFHVPSLIDEGPIRPAPPRHRDLSCGLRHRLRDGDPRSARREDGRHRYPCHSPAMRRGIMQGRVELGAVDGTSHILGRLVSALSRGLQLC
jgi:hypothetical protein